MDKLTDNINCASYFKEALADGEELEVEDFDFCEKELVLEFSEWRRDNTIKRAPANIAGAPFNLI